MARRYTDLHLHALRETELRASASSSATAPLRLRIGLGRVFIQSATGLIQMKPAIIGLSSQNKALPILRCFNLKVLSFT